MMDRKSVSSSIVLDEALRTIREKAGAVRFGTITLTLHDGKLTQLEISEKQRFAH